MGPQRNDAEPRELIAAAVIEARVAELGEEISRDYEGKDDLLLLGVLKGSFIFLADLARQITVPREIEFIALSSYDMGTQSGAVRLEMDLRHPLEHKHVLVVEDIVDTGNTLRYLIELLQSRHPASVRTCALVRRRAGAPDVTLDYVGFDIPDGWVVGYGLDYAERYRTLPYIGILDQD